MNPFLALLALVPVATSSILGVVYLAAGDARAPLKLLGACVFLVAVYLQFLSRYALIGLLVQTALALGLALWRKANAA